MNAMYIKNALSTEIVECDKKSGKQVAMLQVQYNDGSTATMWRIDRIYPDGHVLEGELFSFPLTL